MKLFIATPSRTGTVQVATATSIINLVKLLTSYEVETSWSTISYCGFVHMARQRLAEQFLSSYYTDMLFVDDDIGFDAVALLAMMKTSYDRHEVVGVVCPKRDDDGPPVVNILRGADGNPVMENGLIECAYIGTGLLWIRSAALQVAQSHSGSTLFDVAYENGKPIGEDAWFCRKYRNAGGRVWAQPGVAVTHTGPKSWSLTWQP